MSRSNLRRPGHGNFPRLLFVAAVLFFAIVCAPAPLCAQDQDDEIVATLTGGRVIVHATQEKVTFIAVDEPIETGSSPPRVVSLDGRHIGVLLGSSEWRIPAEPNPIRLDRNLTRIAVQDPRYQGSFVGQAEPDLETVGTAFLERLTPLAARLHHKLDFPTEEPFFELVVIGFGPADYGPEVWTVEYRMAQSMIAARGNYWQTRVLRPRFEQVYPPEKHAPRRLVELCYPLGCKGPSLQQLIEGNEPTLAKLSSSDPKFVKAVALISRGQAQKAVIADAAEFLRAAVPLVHSGRTFVMGTVEEQHGFEWIVPPDEPVERAREDDKNRPPEAPTLRKRVEPPGP